ncbi:hypothetical protein [Bacillus thuringiensis]|uniref:hypothetical protein n=1 Tax=Bacillus thuringiensis TaxID=1428 RepID=UPI0008C00F13|nr:hypothetical protein [Bacillus thuringiensis]MCU4885147.1 hypothetical protein [Bacillus cereus]SEJ44019.1 hypothetical protein SAMN04487780_107110 [Bacillus thuringiensis]
MSANKTQNDIQFSKISNIEECNFHPVLQRFYGMGVRGLVRENIQNARDGKLKGSAEPVIVDIQTGVIDKSDIPGIQEIEEHVLNLVGQNEYTQEIIEHMKKSLNLEEVSYISFEDKNTRGLSGARNGQSNSSQDTFGVYAYSKGFHATESDKELETARGGSHGIGKIASNSASDLHLMYFANCDEYGDKHIGGTIQLVEHEYGGNFYRATGYFSDVKDLEKGRTKYVPFENTYHQIFQKDTRGLKIVIPYFREEFNDEVEIIKTVCDSFAVAVLKGELVVNVNGEVLSKDTLECYVKDPMYYPTEIAKMKKEFTPLYVDTYLYSEPQQIVVNNGERDFNFKLYFTYNEEIPKGRTAIFRTIGMKIEDFKVGGYATKPFNAVLIGELEEDAYLKSLEDESHTTIMNPKIKDPKLKANARKFIKDLSKKIAEIVDKKMRDNNLPDGEMDTADVLYTIETQFKKELEKSLGTVVISEGKQVMKSYVNGTSIKKTRKKTGDDETEERKKRKKRGRKTRNDLIRKKAKKDVSDEMGDSKEIFSINPSLVQRVILQNREIIRIDFTDQVVLKNITTCDISFRVIDGMGEEHHVMFSENYHSITDIHTNREHPLNTYNLKEIAIQNGIVQLSVHLKSNYNRALKFIYYVEV